VRSISRLEHRSWSPRGPGWDGADGQRDAGAANHGQCCFCASHYRNWRLFVDPRRHGPGLTPRGPTAWRQRGPNMVAAEAGGHLVAAHSCVASFGRAPTFSQMTAERTGVAGRSGDACDHSLPVPRGSSQINGLRIPLTGAAVIGRSQLSFWLPISLNRALAIKRPRTADLSYGLAS
jgi:hypothetical protein